MTPFTRGMCWIGVLHFALAFHAFIYAQTVTWNPIVIPDSGVVAIAHSGSTLYVLTPRSLHCTTDDGLSWVRAQATPLGPDAQGGSDILLLAPDTLVLTQWANLWESSDKGSTWQPHPSDISYGDGRLWSGNSGEFFGYAVVWGGLGREPRNVYRYTSDGNYEVVYSLTSIVRDFCVSPTGDYVIADTGYDNPNFPWLYRPPRVMHRTRTNPTWYEFPLTGTFYAIAAVAESRSGRGAMLFAGDNGPGVWRSTDNGTTWSQANNGLTNPFIRKLALASDGTVFSASNGGELFYTKDDGDRWINASPGLPVAGTLVDIAFDTSGHVYVADVNGVYRSSEIIAGLGPGEDAVIPEQSSLAQNYPNPFNPSTMIHYTVVNRQLTILKVYDLLGREVTTLVNEVKDPGTYTVEFDGSALSSGGYLCRLHAGSFVQTRAMLHLKYVEQSARRTGGHPSATGVRFAVSRDM